MKSEIRYDLFLFDLDLLKRNGLGIGSPDPVFTSLQHTPIIIVAADEVIGRLGEPGADECVTKTGDTRGAVETIQRLLRAKVGL